MPDTDAPTLSLCIATAGRAPFVDACLARLAPLQSIGFPIEIVVVDDASTDETSQVLEHWAGEYPFLQAHRAEEPAGLDAALTLAVRKARGEFVVFLGDGDAVIMQALATHVARMIEEPDLAAIYTDWIAWDDDESRELHRHLRLAEPVSFAPGAPLDLVNFVLQRDLWPAVGVYRRRLLQGAWLFTQRSARPLLAMYALSRQGRVRFDPLPFYREQIVPRRGLARGREAAPRLEPGAMGEEMRLGLENLLGQALRDAGVNGLPADQVAKAYVAIDDVLHPRTQREIERARERGDFIEALELKRRLTLWRGLGGGQDGFAHDVLELVLPAAGQAVVRTYESLPQARAISLRGFNSPWIADFLSRWAPDIPILFDGSLSGDDLFILHRDVASRAADPDPDAAEALVFQELVSLYRIAREPIDLSPV